MASVLDPKQERSQRTQEALVRALLKLLETHSFDQVTVAQIAAEAGLTTGAIYRRFSDKRGLLSHAFERFVHDSVQQQTRRTELTQGRSDFERIEIMIRSTLEFMTPYLPIMRASSALNDAGSFEKMREARNIASDWWAGQIQSSDLPEEELRRRMRFAWRIITAVLRDTLLAGPGAYALESEKSTRSMNALIRDLTGMVALHLGVPTPREDGGYAQT